MKGSLSWQLHLVRPYLANVSTRCSSLPHLPQGGLEHLVETLARWVLTKSSCQEREPFIINFHVHRRNCEISTLITGIAFKRNSTAPDIEQAKVTLGVNFTGTLNMMRAFTPIVKPHGRIVNVTASNGHLSHLASSDLRDRFSNPSLTEAELISLMEEFISDVEQGRHSGKWCNTFYASSKVGEIAMVMIYAREMSQTGTKN